MLTGSDIQFNESVPSQTRLHFVYVAKLRPTASSHGFVSRLDWDVPLA